MPEKRFKAEQIVRLLRQVEVSLRTWRSSTDKLFDETLSVNSAVELARLSGRVTPHTLRQTAATWLMQRGVPVWDGRRVPRHVPGSAAGTNGHHHPNHLRGAAVAIGQKRRLAAGELNSGEEISGELVVACGDGAKGARYLLLIPSVA